MSWGQLARDVETMRQQGPVIQSPYLGGFQTRDLAQIADAWVEAQGAGTGNALGLPPVFAVVRLIASTIDQLEITVDGSPAPDWLAYPRRKGAALDLGDLIQWTVSSMALHGAAFIQCTKKSPTGEEWLLEAVHPQSVQVLSTSTGVVSREYRLDGSVIPSLPAKADERGTLPYLLHIPYLVVPGGPPEGVSPLTACRFSLAGYAAVEQQASTLIDQGTYSGGRLETDQDITEVTAKRYQEKWIENRREGKLPVLGAGLSYVNDLINPRDAQWLESRQFNMQQIAAMFGVPVDYLGLALIGGSSSLSYANAQDNDRRFRRNCLEAFTSQIEDALSLLTSPGGNAAKPSPVRFDYEGWEKSGARSGDVGSAPSEDPAAGGRQPDAGGPSGPVPPGDRIRRTSGVVRTERVRPGDGDGDAAAVVPPARRASGTRDSGPEHAGRSDGHGSGSADQPGQGRDDAPTQRLPSRAVRWVRTSLDPRERQQPRIPVGEPARTVPDATPRVLGRGRDRH